MRHEGYVLEMSEIYMQRSIDVIHENHFHVICGINV